MLFTCSYLPAFKFWWHDPHVICVVEGKFLSICYCDLLWRMRRGFFPKHWKGIQVPVFFGKGKLLEKMGQAVTSNKLLHPLYWNTFVWMDQRFQKQISQAEFAIVIPRKHCSQQILVTAVYCNPFLLSGYNINSRSYQCYHSLPWKKGNFWFVQWCKILGDLQLELYNTTDICKKTVWPWVSSRINGCFWFP